MVNIMKNYIFRLIIFILLCGAFWWVALADELDNKVDALAASILTQIQEDVEPIVATPTTQTQTDTSAFLATLFMKTDKWFILHTTAKNARRNGGILIKSEQNAINFLYGKGLTKFNTLQWYQPEALLRRDEAAKFFGLFAMNVMKKSEDEAKECVFLDLAEWHIDLQTNVVSSCRLSLFQWKNGYFNPTWQLTNGEALAVLIRITDGKMDESSANHWAEHYRLKAQGYGLTQWTTMDSSKYLDTPITRGDIARLLEAAQYIPSLKTELGSNIMYSLALQWFVGNQ